MAIMYPWATKEYLLWEMSLAQILLYLNIGIDVKYPQKDSNSALSMKDASLNEVIAKREELRKMYGAV